MILHEIYAEHKRELEEIEKDLKHSLSTKAELLKKTSLHPLESGGKRLRPLFVLLSSGFGNGDYDDVRKLAVSMELIHMATLVHDDVIDQSDLRRGRHTVRYLWDDSVAMITGNYIFSRALELISDLKDARIHQLFSRALLQMCRGEIYQHEDLYDKNVSVRRYLHRVKRKTALLFSSSCQLGSIVSNAHSRHVSRLYTYGYCVGMAFQLIDDVLDFVATESTLGKPVASDLCQGNITLPVIYALQREKQSKEITTYIESRGEEGSPNSVLSKVQELGGIEFTRHLAKRYLEKAIDATKFLPENSSRLTLQWITRFLYNRVY